MADGFARLNISQLSLGHHHGNRAFSKRREGEEARGGTQLTAVSLETEGRRVMQPARVGGSGRSRCSCHLDDEVGVGGQRALLAVHRDVVHQRVVEEPSVGAQLGTNSQSEPVRASQNQAEPGSQAGMGVTDLVTKETVRSFPQQKVLVGVAR